MSLVRREGAVLDREELEEGAREIGGRRHGAARETRGWEGQPTMEA
jgi:hypothetical protein